MKRLLCFVAFVASFMLAVVVSAAVLQPPDQGDPFTQPEVKIEEAFFTRRLVKVKNATEEKLTVFIQYRTIDETNAEVWLPTEPGMGEGLSFDLDPGQEISVDRDGKPITASRIRIWATGQALQFNTHKDEDLWAVPEEDAQEHRYKALEMDTFTYVFSPPPPPAGEILDTGVPLPLPQGEAVAPQPNIVVTCPIQTVFAPDLIPAPLITIIEPAPLVVIPLPPFIPLPQPVIPFPLDADLTAAVFKIDETGVFTGTIFNAGPLPFPGGRKWFVLKSIAGPAKFGSVVAQGEINALLPNGTQDIAGTIGLVTIASRYILALSPGDGRRLNDFSSVVFLQSITAKSDLAAKVQLVGKKLVGTVTNNGPEAFKGDGKRKYQLGDNSGLVTPQIGQVGDLAVGASSTFTLDVSAAINAKTKFFLALNPGDDFKINDTATLLHDPKGKPVVGPDLEAKTLVLKDKKLVGTIVNNGPGEYLGGRTYYLGNGAVSKTASVGPLKVGESQNVALIVSQTVLNTTQVFKLNVLGDDAKPANDSITFKHNVNVPDLAVALTVTGNKVKGTVTNLGKGAYDGTSRTFTLSAPTLGKTYQMGPVGKLKEKETYPVDFTLPAGAPAQTVVFSINNADAKPVNDIATKPYAPDAHDLKVSINIIGNNAKITITNVGATAYPATGKRTITVDRPGLKSLTHNVPGPISKGGSKIDNFPLAGTNSGAKVTAKLSAGDPNVSNDTASDIFAAFDLALGAVTIKGATFSIPLTNKGPAYSAADSYTIVGPGKFKETGKIPNLPKDGGGTITHASKAKLDPGTFTVTLNVADANPANNKKDVVYKAAIFDLAVASVVIKGNTFAIQVANKGPEYSAGDTYTIIGPGKFKETGKIPKLPKDGNGAINHTTKAKLEAGTFTVTLNVKDDDLKNNSKDVNYKAAVFDLAINSALIKGTNFVFQVSNKGPAYSGGDLYTIIGPGKFKETGKIPKLPAGGADSITHTTKAKLETGTFTITLNVKDDDPKNNSKDVNYKAAVFDLAISTITIKGTTFSIQVSNKGPAYSGGDLYTIIGPGKFKETGKIPNLPAGGAGTITHTTKAKLDTGTFTVTLNVKDDDVKNNSKDVNHKAPVDLAIGAVTIKGTTFSIPVSNKGSDYNSGEPYTITGPGGFKEAGKIPNVPKGATITITHAAKAKLGNGTFTVTLNTKDSSPANNTATVSHKEPTTATLAIASLSRDGKNVTVSIKNEGTGDYKSGGGVSVLFHIQHTPPKGAPKSLPASIVPNLAAGASTTITVPDPGAGTIVGSLTGTGSAISTDPNKNKKTVK